MKKIFNWLVITFAFTIPILPFLNVRILLVTLLVSFFIKRPYQSLSVFFEMSWDILLYLLVLILGLLYTNDFTAGLRVLETNFSFLAISIICYRVQRINEYDLRRIFAAFAAGLSLACLICIGNALIQVIKGDSIQAFFFYRLTGVIDSHPTYLAYYLIFAITLGLHFLYYENPVRPWRFWVIIMIIFFFLMLMLTGGKTSFISLLMVFSFFLLKYLSESITPNKTTILGLTCFMIFGIFVVNSLASRGKFWPSESDYWERSMLWESAIKANPNYLIGTGTGGDKKILNEYYRSHGLEKFAVNNYNSHNQFLQSFISHGVVGLLSLLLLIGRPLILGMRSQTALRVLIFFPFIVYGMNEVFLGRYQGVVFFAFLHQLLIFRFADEKVSAY